MAADESTTDAESIAVEMLRYQKASWWRRWGGGALTFVWVGTAFCVAGMTDPAFFSLELNEMGDFLAGVFAPVAFLWLILGYAQQADELRMTRNEVSRQAKALETNNSQQEILAQTAQITHALDMEDRKRRNDIEIRKAQPMFKQIGVTFRGSDVSASNPTMLVRIAVHNVGKLCWNLSAVCLSRPDYVEFECPYSEHPVAFLNNGASVECSFRMPGSELRGEFEVVLQVSYTDDLIERTSVVCRIHVSQEGSAKMLGSVYSFEPGFPDVANESVV